ncbi:endonuclease III [Desulfuromonas thiophila]|uniref:Endonuclease III n=1 Tax=Desulfuromonas thiophila TaxID=57664 RepID=A0A1G7E617_9BACT|nr:endonuclease III [Desulfuromonas thiophila]SDE59131.1 DNA-(apurinic or apyrimidinic site) lyase /endonuclease III [Desulfuromonas thiophila]
MLVRETMACDGISQILNYLLSCYPQAACSLNFQNPYELLISTILSAQTTDVRVNQVTKELFIYYSDPFKLASAKIDNIEQILRSIGCYRVKSRNIILCAQQLVNQFNGVVPKNFEELVKLPGVGRKTANVVLSNAFNIPRLAVDTHVRRVSYRLGLSDSTDVRVIEQDLCRKITPELWCKVSHLLIFHGRNCCKARRPACSECCLIHLCPKNIKSFL